MYAKVIVGLNQPEMDKLFDYRIPEGMTAEIGVRVIGAIWQPQQKGGGLCHFSFRKNRGACG